MKCSCGCDKEFEPSRAQLGQLNRGSRIYRTKECGDMVRKRERRERHKMDQKSREAQRKRLQRWREKKSQEAVEKNIERNKRIIEAKEKASLDCAEYKNCIDSLCKTRKELRCDLCKSPAWKPGAWMKTIERDGFKRGMV